MYAAERQQAILERARDVGRVEVVALSEALGVTVETVRRDLTALERLGVVRRVHGGALPVERLMLEQHTADRQVQATAEKRTIAERALTEIPHGGSVLLDSGTTTLAIAHAMPGDMSATVVTNSFAIAAALADRPSIDLVLLGGRVRHRTGAAVGGMTIEALAGMCADVAFMGTNGFDVAHGFTTPDQAESDAKRAMVGAARRAIVVSDSTKAGQIHLHRFARTADAAMLITDLGLDRETAEDLEAAGVEVARV